MRASTCFLSTCSPIGNEIYFRNVWLTSATKSDSETNDYNNMPCFLQTIANKHYRKVQRSFHSFTHKRDTFQGGIVVSLLQPFKVWPSINNGSVSEPRTLHVFCNDVSVGSLAVLDATKMRGISSNRWKNTIRHRFEILVGLNLSLFSFS